MFCGKYVFVVFIFLYNYFEVNFAVVVAPSNELPVNPNPLGLKYVNGKKYWIGNYVKRNYDEALKSCQRYGMELVNIRNKEEHEIVKDLLKGLNGLYWTSGNMLNDHKTWVWSRGIPFTYSAGWNQGEPNNILLNEYCIELIEGNRKFDDDICSRENYYVCESIENTCDCCGNSNNTSPKKPHWGNDIDV